VLPGDAEGAVRRAVAVGEDRVVARAVELRARVVGHPAVDRDVVDATAPLGRADAVERDAGPPYERAPGFEDDASRIGPARSEARDERQGERARVGHLLAGGVGHAEPAAEVDEPRRPAQLVAAASAERKEPVDSEQALVGASQLRSDVDMDAEWLEPVERRLERRERLLWVEPELRLVVRGLDRLVRLRLDSGCKPHQHAAHADLTGSGDLLGRVEHKQRVGRRSRVELGIGLVVPVDDQTVAAHPRASREGELPERRDVCAEPLLREEPEDPDARERLDPVDHERVRVDAPVGACLRDERLAAVDDERRAESLRELRRCDTPQRERARSDLGAVRKELEGHA
jgi:hypothetical protein